MHALVQIIAFRGIDTIPVDVQVHIANGLPTSPLLVWQIKLLLNPIALSLLIAATGRLCHRMPLPILTPRQ